MKVGLREQVCIQARSQKKIRGASKDRVSPGNVAIFRPLSLILMAFLQKVYIIAKQFEDSRIKRMCIFHVLTVRGLPGSEGASAPCMQTSQPGETAHSEIKPSTSSL